MSYRDDLAALDARIDALRHEVAAKVEELESTKRLADDARAIVRARVGEAELATPCAASWDEMVGDDRVRHCRHCRKHVYNFSELTRREIDALVRKTEGRLCARFFMRSDGTMLSKDCTAGIRLRPRRLAVAVGAAAIAAAAAVGAGGAIVQAQSPETEFPERYELEHLSQAQGGMEVDVEDLPPPPDDTDRPYVHAPIELPPGSR